MNKREVHITMDRKGLALVEILIGLVVTIIVVGVIVSVYITSDKVFRQNKSISDVKEITKLGMEQLEWLFQRWGTSTPCNDPTIGGSECTPIRDCRVAGNFTYPPPSSMCITIDEGNPCDEIILHANLYGNGYIDRLSSPSTAAVMSCRLSEETGRNCYHLKRGGLFIRDAQDDHIALIFLIGGLSSDGLDCVNVSGNSNGSLNRQVTALNGNVRDSANQLTTTFNIEGGDLLIRVPHRLRLFCQSNPQDNNSLWLYMEATDMSSSCNAHEPPIPLNAVNSFKAEQQGQGVFITMQLRGPDNKTMNVQRFFGR